MYDVFDNRQQHVDPARESGPEDRREYTVVQNPTRSGTGDWQQVQAQDLRQRQSRFGSCLILPCGQKKGRRQPRKSRLWFNIRSCIRPEFDLISRLQRVKFLPTIVC